MAPHADEPVAKTQRIPEYDAVRGIAIGMVLIWHYFNNLITDKTGPFAHFFLLATRNFWSGVDLFFVLSGFLVGGILLKHRQSQSYFRTFYIRRICRIFPLYYFYLGIYYLLLHSSAGQLMPWVFGNTFPFWSYLSFTQNFMMAKYQSMGAHAIEPTWSLAVEEQFYLLIPLVIFFIKGKRLVLLILAASAAALYFRLMAAPNWYAAFSLLPCRADALLLGVLAALLSTDERTKTFFEKQQQYCWLIFYALLLFFFANSMKIFAINYYVNYSFQAVFYAYFILLIRMNITSWRLNFLQNKILQHIGRLSFGIYIYHYFVLGLVHYLVLKEAPQISTITNLLVTFLALGVLYLVSLLSYHAFEKRIIDWGHRYVY